MLLIVVVTYYRVDLARVLIRVLARLFNKRKSDRPTSTGTIGFSRA